MSGFLPQSIIDQLLLNSSIGASTNRGQGPTEKDLAMAQLLADPDAPRYPAPGGRPDFGTSETLSDAGVVVPASGSGGSILDRIKNVYRNVTDSGVLSRTTNEGLGYKQEPVPGLDTIPQKKETKKLDEKFKSSDSLTKENKKELNAQDNAVVEVVPVENRAPVSNKGKEEVSLDDTSIVNQEINPYDQAALSLAQEQTYANRASALSKVNSLDSQIEYYKSLVDTPEQAQLNKNEYETGIKKLMDTNDEIIKGIMNNAPKKENWGVSLGKALASGLGAYASAMTGTPNYALQIIENAADRSAKEVAAQSDKFLKLSGLTQNQIELFNQKHKTRTEKQQFYRNAINEASLLKAKAVAEANDNKPMIDALNNASKSRNAMLKQNIDVDKANRETGLMPKGQFAVFDIKGPQFNKLNKEQRTSFQAQTESVSQLRDIYGKMMNLYKKAELVDLDGAETEALKNYAQQIATIARSVQNFGAATGNELELTTPDVSKLRSWKRQALGSAKSELASRTAALVDLAGSKFTPYGISFTNPIRQFRESLGKEFGE